MRRKRVPVSLVREAQKRINQIRENVEELRAQEGKARANDYLRSERTASLGQDAVKVLIRAGVPLPSWVGNNWRYLEAMSWHQPHLSFPFKAPLQVAVTSLPIPPMEICYLMASKTELPSLVMAPTDCPVCGAKTVSQAQKKCRASQDPAHSTSCMIGNQDEDGNFVMPTPESYAAFEIGFSDFLRE